MSESRPTLPGLFGVYGLLLLLAAGTTALSFVNLGAWNVAAAMVVAGVKAVLVVLYFMHLRYSPKLTWVFAAAGLYMLGILFVGTLNDVRTRAWLSPFLGGAP
ncbi:MAG: cytochrome C oxidase subunit IV family protein [Planctomycetaceae bacterium]|nr:cytochrome C oxidase subunit IV family protein [Planctomycetaceae bacterium]